MQAIWSYRALAAWLVFVSAATVHGQERLIGVRQPPETVFDVPVQEVIPQLEGGSQTGENGRVGGELVFWGYRLADGKPAYLFACAMLPDVDCESRIAAICPAGTTVLERVEHGGGNIVHRRCTEVAIAAPGDLHPGCVETAAESTLLVGLAACN